MPVSRARLVGSVMIAVEHLFSTANVVMFFADLIPGQFGDRFEVGTDDLAFLRLGRGTIKPFAFPQQLFTGRIGDMLDALYRLGKEHRVFHRGVAFAEFLRDHPHLFAEKIIPLVFIHRLFDLVVDFLLPAHDRNFAVDNTDQHPDSCREVRFFQQRLFVLDLQKQALDNLIVHSLDRLLRQDSGHNLIRHFGNHLGIIVKAVNQRTHHAFLLILRCVQLIMVIKPPNLGSIKFTGKIIRNGLSLIQALDHNPN